MNKEEIKGDIGKEVIEDSCGCVLCDIDIPTYRDKDGNRVHQKKQGDSHWFVPCTKPR